MLHSNCYHHCTLHPNCLQPFKGLSATILRESLYATGYLAIAPILREALSKQPAVQVRWRGARGKLPDGSTGPAGSERGAALGAMPVCPSHQQGSTNLSIDDSSPNRAGHTGRAVRAERHHCRSDCHRVLAASRHHQDTHAGGQEGAVVVPPRL